jgi:hypothetical protein
MRRSVRDRIGIVPGVGLALGLALGHGLGIGHGLVPIARAQLALGWVERAPSIADDAVFAASLGVAHDDDGPLAAARLAARRRGEARAREALHRWADDALSEVGAGPRDAQAVHDAIDRATTVSRVRARADGSALVEVRCPLRALRDAFDAPRCPWRR